MMLRYPLQDGANDGTQGSAGGNPDSAGSGAGAPSGTAAGGPAAGPSIAAQAAGTAAPGPASILAQASGAAPAAGAGEGEGKVVRDPSVPAWVPEKFKTGEDFAKSYQELTKRMGDVGLPPKTADEYQWNPPNGMEFDAEATKGFREFALNAGLSKKQYAAVMDAYVQHLDALGGDALSFAADKAMRELTQHWGSEQAYRQNATKGYKVLKTFLDESELAEFENVNHPAVWKLLAKIGAELPEDAGLANAVGNTQDAESELKKLQADPAYMDAKNPQHAQIVARVTELNHIIVARRNRGM